MKNNKLFNYAAIIGCIIFLTNVLVAQEVINTLEVFQRPTDATSITKINTNTDEKLFVEETYESENEYFNIIFLCNKDSIYIDTVRRTTALFINKYGDTTYYHPATLSNAFYYIKDTLFCNLDGTGIAIYTKEKNHFKPNDLILFDNSIKNLKLNNIIGYKNGNLIIANQMFDSYGLNYNIALFDLHNKKITKTHKFDFGNSIMLNFYNINNVYATNKNLISIMNLIKPQMYLLDYNLNIVDSIDFTFNNDYKTTQHHLDTNVSVNKSLIDYKNPKMVIILLENIKQLNYSLNMKQMFVNDSTLLVLSKELLKDTCDAIRINIKTKQKEILFKYPFWGDSPYTSLNSENIIPLFSNGIFVYDSTALTDDEENVKYFLKTYHSQELDFSNKNNEIVTKRLDLEDRKKNKVSVDINDYDAVIVFDMYLCKTCFAKEYTNTKILFIDNDSSKDKMSRLRTYKELKRIYPNADIYFNTDHKFNIEKNKIFDTNSVIKTFW